MKYSSLAKLWFLIVVVATVAFLGYGWRLGDGFLYLGYVWILVGGILTVAGLIMSFMARRSTTTGLYLALIPLALIYAKVGIDELDINMFSDYYSSPSRTMGVLVQPLGDSGTPPYRIQIKRTFLPFFSLFGRTVFEGDCPWDAKVTWPNDQHVQIGCSSASNLSREPYRDAQLQIEFILSEQGNNPAQGSSIAVTVSPLDD